MTETNEFNPLRPTLARLTELLIELDDVRNNYGDVHNGIDLDVLYDDLAMIHDRINPESYLNRNRDE